MTFDPRQSRGYRNRNPGNIDYVPANKWTGQIGLGDSWLPPDKRRFAEFHSAEWGIRALARLLTTYQTRYGLRTVSGIINRWAPPKNNKGQFENHTSAYVSGVAAALGVSPYAVIDLSRYDTMKTIVEAIIKHELGGQPYGSWTIVEGLRRAGLTP